MGDDVDGDEATVPRVPNLPPEPSARQIVEHELTGHAVYRSWCRHCVASKGRAHAHSSREDGELPEIGIDYGFFGRESPNSVHFRPVGENNAMRGGDQRMLRDVHGGHHDRSGSAIFLTPVEMKRETIIARLGAREMGFRVQCNVFRSSLAEAVADQGVAPVIVMPAVPETEWRRYVTKRDLVQHGYTDECQACAQLASGMHNSRSHWRTHQKTMIRDKRNECLGLFVQRLEFPRPKAGEEMDVGERKVDLPQPVQQPVPTVRVGGSSSSRNPSWIGFKSK